jgi:ribonuclease HI
MEFAAKPVYYAVHRGIKPGVYTTWSETQRQVSGFSKAVYKKFSNLEEARAFAEVGHCRVTGSLQSRGKRVYVVNDPIDSEGARPISDLLKRKRQRDSDDPKDAKHRKIGVQSPFSFGAGRTLTVHTDGACRDNGRTNARASYGIFFGEGDPRNSKGMVPWKPWTNQRGELYAILKTLQLCEQELKDREVSLIIKTDSKYSIDVFTNWIDGWKRRGFITARGEPVENQDIILPIDDLLHRYGTVRLIKVRGHSGDFGNEQADRLANQALDEYEASLPK